jgi:phospholipase/carboxylesterase
MSALLECVELQTHGAPSATVIWLHGLGADGYDFVPVVRELEANGAPAARYVFPHAPQRAVTINNGYVMRAWYDILGTELVRREDAQGIHDSQERVQALLDREVARGVPAGRVVLAGFSQGGAIALQAGLRQAQPLAGIVALSTYLPLAATLAAERPAASAQVPVFMAHGTADPIVQFVRGTESRDALIALGQPVEWHDYPMAHSVNSDEIVAIARFLARVLAT